MVQRVLEVGSGCCGVTGMVVSFVARETVLSDFQAKVMKCLRANAKTHLAAYPALAKKLSVIELDWCSDLRKTATQPAFLQGATDVILGTEVMYDERLTGPLARVINFCLAPNGTFYGLCPTFRKGVQSFIDDMASTGLDMRTERFTHDAIEYILYIATRRNGSSSAHTNARK